ncbi:MAG: M24 family metallopeptidase [Bacteriovoracaceae bacterium]|nr:M24 family metallopeptidase [Bacteriovoracaceae bacterium]
MKSEEVKTRIKEIQKFADKKNLDAIYISSFDIFLSEYVPLGDNHRYYVSGFSGSVAEVLIPVTGRALLFVDGRYHEQASNEVDDTIVEVVKVPYGVELGPALVAKGQELKVKNLGVEGDRIPLGFEKVLSKSFSVVGFDLLEISKLIDAPGFSPDNEVTELSDKITGESTDKKIRRTVNPKEGFFLSSLDSISWICNLRGYHHPFQSTFIAKALVLKDRVILFSPSSVKYSSSIESNENFTIYELDWDQLEDKLTELAQKVGIDKLFFDPLTTTSADFRILMKSFGAETLKEKDGGISELHATKNSVEVNEMEKSFERSAKVIKDIIDWTCKEATSRDVTELEYFQKANKFYADSGALALSFKTIAGIGANSSIIHYGSPSQDVLIKDGDMALLDSGAFYESGLATDCTRAFLPKGTPTEKQKKIYTLVLRGLIGALNAVFPEGTPGSFVDSIARAPMRAHGYDYAHGTGHGIGINVHESGYRLTPFSQTPLVEGRVGSLEPGIYIPGFGGVRLENIAVVEKHPEFEGMLRFRTLIYLGFMPNLIEKSLMTTDEISWLENYEKECEKRSLSFNN